MNFRRRRNRAQAHEFEHTEAPQQNPQAAYSGPEPGATVENGAVPQAAGEQAVAQTATLPPPMGSPRLEPQRWPETTVPVFSAPVPAGLWPAVRRHWVLAVLPVIALTAAGLAYGLHRQPTYTATAKLAVSKLELTSPGALAGFTQAAQALAETFSRSVDAAGVVNPTARALGIPSSVVQSRTSAVPVAQTPVFLVTATGPSRRSAVTLANATSVSLVAYLKRVNSTDSEAHSLLSQYRSQAQLVEQARSARDAALHTYQTKSTGANLAALQTASAVLETGQTHLQALQVAYQDTVENNPSPDLVQFVTPADAANSDRRSKIALFAFAGLVAGLVVGVALVSLRSLASSPRT